MIQFPFTVCSTPAKQILNFAHPYTANDLKQMGIIIKSTSEFEDPTTEAQSYKKQVMSWFFSLSPEKKQEVSSISCSVLAKILIQMLQYTNRIRQGYGTFLYYNDNIAEDDIEFKHLMATSDYTPDRYILKSLRFFSTATKYDSITMDLDFFLNDVNLLNLLHENSGGNYFVTPCSFKFDQDKKLPVWRIPSWFLNKKVQTISNVVVCMLERSISMKYIYYQVKGIAFPVPRYITEISSLQPYVDKITTQEKESIYTQFIASLNKLPDKQMESKENYKIIMKLRGFFMTGYKFIQSITMVPSKYMKNAADLYGLLLQEILSAHGKLVATTLIQEESMQNVKKAKPHRKPKPANTKQNSPLPVTPQQPVTPVAVPPVQKSICNAKSTTTDSSHSDNDHYREKNKKRYKRKQKHSQADKEQTTLSSKSKLEAANLFKEIIGDSKKHASVPAFCSNSNPIKEKTITYSYWKLDEEISAEIKRIDDNMRSLWPYRKLFLSSLSYILVSSKNPMLMNLRYDLYGSIKTGLAVESSDMDVALSDPNICNFIQIRVIFEQLQNLFQKEDYIHSIKYIDTARVPVLKMEIDLEKLAHHKGMSFSSKYSHLMKVDINIWYTDQNTMVSTYAEGMHTVNFIVSILEKGSMHKPLIVLMKKLLKLKNYNNKFEGGLSSYAIVLMVDAYLSTYGPFSSVAEAFLGMLKFYSKDMEYSRYGVAYNSISMSYVMMAPTDALRPQLVIIDPLDPMTIVTQSTFRYEEIKEYMGEIYSKLMNTLEKPYPDRMLCSIFTAAK